MNRIWDTGRSPLLDVDVKGGLNVQSLYPKESLSLFIEPPSLEELDRRLQARGTETEESRKSRLSKAAYEMTFKHKFDHIIINDKLDRACAVAERLVREFLSLTH